MPTIAIGNRIGRKIGKGGTVVPSFSLSLTCLYETFPMRDIVLRVSNGDNTYEGTTDDNGVAVLKVKPGTYSIVSLDPGVTVTDTVTIVDMGVVKSLNCEAVIKVQFHEPTPYSKGYFQEPIPSTIETYKVMMHVTAGQIVTFPSPKNFMFELRISSPGFESSTEIADVKETSPVFVRGNDMFPEYMTYVYWNFNTSDGTPWGDEDKITFKNKNYPDWSEMRYLKFVTRENFPNYGGEYIWEATCENAEPLSGSFDLTSGDQINLYGTFQIERKKEIKFMVLDGRNQGIIKGAALSLNGTEYVADDQGSFTAMAIIGQNEFVPNEVDYINGNQWIYIQETETEATIYLYGLVIISISTPIWNDHNLYCSKKPITWGKVMVLTDDYGNAQMTQSKGTPILETSYLSSPETTSFVAGNNFQIGLYLEGTVEPIEVTFKNEDDSDFPVGRYQINQSWSSQIDGDLPYTSANMFYRGELLSPAKTLTLTSLRLKGRSMDLSLKEVYNGDTFVPLYPTQAEYNFLEKTQSSIEMTLSKLTYFKLVFNGNMTGMASLGGVKCNIGGIEYTQPEGIETSFLLPYPTATVPWQQVPLLVSVNDPAYEPYSQENSYYVSGNLSQTTIMITGKELWIINVKKIYSVDTNIYIIIICFGEIVMCRQCTIQRW